MELQEIVFRSLLKMLQKASKLSKFASIFLILFMDHFDFCTQTSSARRVIQSKELFKRKPFSWDEKNNHKLKPERNPHLKKCLTIRVDSISTNQKFIFFQPIKGQLCSELYCD